MAIYSHCARCGSSDVTEIGHSSGVTYFRCEDCGNEFECDDDYIDYDSSWGWHRDGVSEDDDE